MPTFGRFGQAVSLFGSTTLIGLPDANYLLPATGSAYFYGTSNLEITVSAPRAVSRGQFVSQTIVTNNSSVASPAVAVSIAVPAAATFVSATATTGNCKKASETIRCDFGPISGNAGVATANVKLRVTGKKGEVIKQVAGIVEAAPALTASASTTITNTPPVANDGSLTTDENISANGTLEASDADSDPLTFSIVSKPTHGKLSLDDASTGAYTYTPNQGYSGSDSFTFKANDGKADSNTATISITVKAAPPPSGGGGGGATGPLGLGLLVLAGLVALVRRKR